MVLAKRTSKNQLTLPKAIVEQIGAADYYDVVCEGGKIVLTPVNPGGASAVRARLAEMGINDVDVAEAVSWARRWIPWTLAVVWGSTTKVPAPALIAR